MRVKTSDGIDIYCLPECAKCKLTEAHIDDMVECPCFDYSEICTPDCYYYEDWEENKNENTNQDTV